MSVDALFKTPRRRIQNPRSPRLNLARSAIAFDRAARPAAKTPRPAARTQEQTEGKKVAPKYRGPKGATWAGRGLKPKWLVAEIKKGKKLESFAIK